MSKQMNVLAAVWPKAKLLINHRGVRRIAQSCIDAAFPTRCTQCENMYHRDTSPIGSDSAEDQSQAYGDLLADYLCPQCAALYQPIHSPLCNRCGRSFATRHGVDHECPDCLKRPFAFDAARAAGQLDPTMKTLIHQYKYQGRTELAKPLGKMLWQALHRFYDLDAFDLILPVPLHWYRQYRRGFNQSSQLLRQWEALLDGQGGRPIPILDSGKVLFRQRHTTSQTGLGRDRRIKNLKNAFVVRDSVDVRKKHILLVDDVLTTGATTSACAKVLKRAGVASVRVLTVARA